MTIEILKDLCRKYHIPPDVELFSDSGWECGPTDMNGVYYNAERQAIVFSQGRYFEDWSKSVDKTYSSDDGWQIIYFEPVDSRVNSRVFGA